MHPIRALRPLDLAHADPGPPVVADVATHDNGAPKASTGREDNAPLTRVVRLTRSRGTPGCPAYQFAVDRPAGSRVMDRPVQPSPPGDSCATTKP